MITVTVFEQINLWYQFYFILLPCRSGPNWASSNSRYWVARPIRIEYFKHVTELIHSRPISVQDFMGVSTTCKTITKSLPTFPRHVRHTKSHVSTNFILTSYLALQSGRVWPPIDVTPFQIFIYRTGLKKLTRMGCLPSAWQRWMNSRLVDHLLHPFPVEHQHNFTREGQYTWHMCILMLNLTAKKKTF